MSKVADDWPRDAFEEDSAAGIDIDLFSDGFN
jgi:hypothetical protein